MNFNNINQDNDCKCLKDSYEDKDNVFSRKIKNSNISEKDFDTYWERGKKSNKCKDICKYKGLSINIFNDISKESIRKKYIEMKKHSPGYYTTNYIIFKLLENAGKVKRTPSNNDKYHYTFYKCDDFNFERINILDTISIKMNV